MFFNWKESSVILVKIGMKPEYKPLDSEIPKVKQSKLDFEQGGINKYEWFSFKGKNE